MARGADCAVPGVLGADRSALRGRRVGLFRVGQSGEHYQRHRCDLCVLFTPRRLDLLRSVAPRSVSRANSRRAARLSPSPRAQPVRTLAERPSSPLRRTEPDYLLRRRGEGPAGQHVRLFLHDARHVDRRRDRDRSVHQEAVRVRAVCSAVRVWIEDER